MGAVVIDKSFLVKIFGYHAAIRHGDTAVEDRWRFLKSRLPRTRNGETLLDAGCGTGALTIGAAKRGYNCVGLSWDVRNQEVAQHRATLCGVPETSFPIQDLRSLSERRELAGRFDVVLSFENAEHILDDRKLMRDLAACLRPGGRLIMTAPNYYYRAITPEDDGPFVTEETGWHVRRGYTSSMLAELADQSGLVVEEIAGCTGFISQCLILGFRRLGFLGWALTFPLRVLPPILDRFIARVTRFPDYSICMVAYRPRFGALGSPSKRLFTSGDANT